MSGKGEIVGSAELVQNKTMLKGKQQVLGYANFSSFLDKKSLDDLLEI